MQTKHLALPVGRAQDSYKFPTSEAVIPEVAAAAVLCSSEPVALGKDPGVLHKENLNTTTTPEDDDTGYYLRLVATEGVSHQEMVGGVVGYAGLPGQQPDGQVDEASCQ